MEEIFGRLSQWYGMPHEQPLLKQLLKDSPLWPFFITLGMVEDMWARKQKEFAEWLLKVGDGTLCSEVHVCVCVCV